jgi:ubiquinol-cytochrome c reductase cytochrome c subunit
VLWFALPLVLATVSLPASRGATLYTTACASCHTAQKTGGPDGPSLRGVGPAVLDFYLATGRMPAAVPWLEVGQRDERSGQALSLPDIRALETYLASTVAGGPALPLVTAGGNLEHGRALYAIDCEQCHSVGGVGGDLGGVTWVPALNQASINVVADAIRAGPGEMPRFSDRQLDQRDLNDVASYVMKMQSDPQAGSGPPFRSTGPIPEGAVAYLAMILLVAFVFTFWRSDTPPGRREEAVRRDEGERPA